MLCMYSYCRQCVVLFLWLLFWCSVLCSAGQRVQTVQRESGLGVWGPKLLICEIYYSNYWGKAVSRWTLYSIFSPNEWYVHFTLQLAFTCQEMQSKRLKWGWETKHWFEHVASGIRCMMVMEEVQTGMERIGQQDSWTKWKRASDRKSNWSDFQRVDIQDMKWLGWYHDRVLRVITEAKTQKRAPTIQEPSMSSDQWRSHS